MATEQPRNPNNQGVEFREGRLDPSASLTALGYKGSLLGGLGGRAVGLLGVLDSGCGSCHNAVWPWLNRLPSLCPCFFLRL